MGVRIKPVGNPFYNPEVSRIKVCLRHRQTEQKTDRQNKKPRYKNKPLAEKVPSTGILLKIKLNFQK